MAKVWVVMGNDYPEAVFSTNKAAQDYCDRQTKANKLGIEAGTARRVYYRAYGFVVDIGVPGYKI